MCYQRDIEDVLEPAVKAGQQAERVSVERNWVFTDEKSGRSFRFQNLQEAVDFVSNWSKE